MLLEAQQAYWGAVALSAHYSRPGRHRIMQPRYAKINVGMKRTFVGDAFKLVVKKTHLIVKGMGLNVERGQSPFWVKPCSYCSQTAFTEDDVRT